MDYKSTLNLPNTGFPMKANLPEREPTILKKWESLNLYYKNSDYRQSQPKFVLHDGPPYANGHIHMGTTLNKILKDIVVKSKQMSGFNAPYIPGWDCHGLPIELNVEKKIGKPGQKVSHAEFRKACREYAKQFIDIQREEFKRLGILAAWDQPYLTMDYQYEANIIRSLARIVAKGHLQKGSKPVYWCLDCASALAEAEVEYKDKTSPAIDVRFRVVDEKEFATLFNLTHTKPISVPIWTTTPWTLPGNEAVAINPYIEYCLVELKDECLLIAAPLVESVLKKYQSENYQIIGTTLGENLEKRLLQHPFYDKEVPIILGEHVTMDSGTGAVHTAPAHGVDDYEVGKKYNLPVVNPVGDDGCFTKQTPLFAGEHVKKVNDHILEVLKEKNVLLHQTTITHSFPHCWRHKTPLIFRATPQWFISMDQNGLRQKALDAIKRVKWIPDWGQNRILSMVENRPDWCVSRQRCWGVPIPFFLHKETGALHPNTAALMEQIADRVEKEGVEAWFSLSEKDLLGPEADEYRKNNDILDVWFDSGVSHACVLKERPELLFPADLYLEGSDQHRGWFQSSLLTSVAMNDREPFQAVLTHGYVVDVQKQKMSKSLGNVIAPETIINKLGADVMRLWIASVDYRAEIFVSDEVFTRTSETYRRIRNTSRFLLANLNGFDPNQNCVAAGDMLALDRFIVDKARRLQDEIIKAYHSYQFHLVYQRIQHFCTMDLGSFYLDIIKDRQYTTQKESLARRSAQTALFHIAEALVRWMAPILSFTAEEIWSYLPGTRNESVFLNNWYNELAELDASEKMNGLYWDQIQLVRNAVNKELENLRNEGKIGSGLEAKVSLYCDEKLKKELDLLAQELRFVLITSAAEVHSLDPAMSDLVSTEVPGLALRVEAVSDQKCERCWHRLPDVGLNPAHPTLCMRCINNVDGTGEIRKFA